MPTTYAQRAADIMQRIHELAAISETPGVVTRTFGTPAFVRGRALVQQWMQQAGLETRIDNIGNLRGRLRSPRPGAQTFVIGSHIDTVVNAGRFDGPLGVLLGLDLLAQLQARQTELPFHLELLAFSDEEGVRFHTTYLGSKVLTGAFEPALLLRPDATGVPLAEAIRQQGGDPAGLPADALPAAAWRGYFEVHIEQGPVLWERQVPVALVTAIAGQRRVELTFRGMAGHAGTVPMPMRQDALAGAAEFVLAAEQLATKHGRGLVATVGKLQLPHAASNVIPGEVSCSLDLRSPDETELAAAYAALQQQAEALAARRGLTLDWQLIQQTAPVACDAALNQPLSQAIAAAGHEVIALVSGAGHDAVPVAQVAPATMLFVRCYRGISHNPLENVEPEDLAAALQVAEEFLTLLVSAG
ncbi:allantoate amidohydrolase [Hymenobacter gummosus]|uniref:Allantoate amidohydrolase n=1 Tax=Hymenobacter gummosus TaxID=1776032 RepID=A0A431U3J2_9BACT|nr:allantoate amidohydrolase [Hymenobacter gummosus]RTQ50057.1 allantoate amidohydrolase [Hymenobacter gummosus]